MVFVFKVLAIVFFEWSFLCGVNSLLIDCSTRLNCWFVVIWNSCQVFLGRVYIVDFVGRVLLLDKFMEVVPICDDYVFGVLACWVGL